MFVAGALKSGGMAVNMNRSSDFRQKEVINITDGKRLGFVSDVEIDLESGKIDAIILPGVGKLFGILGKESEFVVPWDKIRKVGEDIILVELDDRYIKRYFD
jgi:YlmC/YmxH family sporulation protein